MHSIPAKNILFKSIRHIMQNHLYAESVPVFTHFLNNLKVILQKAKTHTTEHKIEEAALLTDRLFPDMFTMTRQVQIACDSAKGAVARLAGFDIPKHADVESSFDELIARIDTTLYFIGSIDQKAFEGSQARQVVLEYGDWRREFTATEFLRTWALPNFYFHIATAYGLLRQNGVTVGKMDFLG
jgi:hypothetical protein